MEVYMQQRIDNCRLERNIRELCIELEKAMNVSNSANTRDHTDFTKRRKDERVKFLKWKEPHLIQFWQRKRKTWYFKI